MSGELWSTPSSSFLVDLYATSGLPQLGHGGGQRYLGEVAGHDERRPGRGTFTKATTVAAGEVVTATATTTGGFVDGATSEFSRCAPRGLVATGMTEPADAGDEQIEVGDNDDFDVGDEITVNPGASNEETAIVTGFGSLILDSRSRTTTPAGELVVVEVQPPGSAPHGHRGAGQPEGDGELARPARRRRRRHHRVRGQLHHRQLQLHDRRRAHVRRHRPPERRTPPVHRGGHELGWRRPRSPASAPVTPVTPRDRAGHAGAATGKPGNASVVVSWKAPIEQRRRRRSPATR